MFLFLCFVFTPNKIVDQILLFVSDGRGYNDIGGNPLEVIQNENEALQNRVVINTYGIGTGKFTDDQHMQYIKKVLFVPQLR